MSLAPPLSELLAGRELLIFDFDGTLADSSPLHAAAFAHVLAPLQVTVDYPAIAGMKTADGMVRCLAAGGRTCSDLELAELVAAKQHHVRELIRHRLEPLPGVDAFLRWARAHHRLAMFSSGSRGTVDLSLARLGYTGWFEPMLCAEDVARAKPDPEGYLRVLELTGVPAHHALVFEDAEAGLLAARRAGLAVLDVRPPFAYAELLSAATRSPGPVLPGALAMSAHEPPTGGLAR